MHIGRLKGLVRIGTCIGQLKGLVRIGAYIGQLKGLVRIGAYRTIKGAGSHRFI